MAFGQLYTYAVCYAILQDGAKYLIDAAFLFARALLTSLRDTGQPPLDGHSRRREGEQPRA